MRAVDLRNKQCLFTLMIAELVLYANTLGLGLTYADAYAKTGHMKQSLHYCRLAVDFNLIIDGKYTEDIELYRPIGEYWVEMGGSWGGNFIKKDMWHFSLYHEGRR